MTCRSTLLLVALTSALIIFAPRAQAQVDENSTGGGTGGDCGLSAEYSQPCDIGGTTTNPGGGQTLETCKTTSATCKECETNCCCNWKNNYKRCNGSAACIDVALSERNACYGTCANDYEGTGCSMDPNTCKLQ